MILLDTHVWLWLNGAVERLSAEALALLAAPEKQLYLSVASAWEIGIKVATGKLVLPAPPSEYLLQRMGNNRVLSLPISQNHALKAAALPPHHRDPFDRMLVAQAQLEGLRLMTVDEKLAKYDVPILWADRGLGVSAEPTSPAPRVGNGDAEGGH
jgi:PIN domain nuclease of toxin-antitoxin system